MNSRYLARIAAFVLGLALFLRAVVQLVVPPDVYALRLARLSEIIDDIEIITLGNSHGRSFHFASMNLVGFHFFEQAGDLEEMERRADVVIDRLPALKYVLLPLSPGALRISQRVISDDYEERRLLVRKGTPLTFDWGSYSLEELVGTATYRLFHVDSLQNSFYGLLGYENETRTADAMRTSDCFETQALRDPADLVYDVPEEGIIDGYRRLVMNYDCLPKYGKASSRKRQSHIKLTQERYPAILERNVARLLKLASKLEARDVVLVIVNTPSTPWHYDSVATSELKPRFEDAIGELVKHPNIRYFDFHDLYYADLENGENSYFFDDNHLALIGARKFSTFLAEKLSLSDGRER